MRSASQSDSTSYLTLRYVMVQYGSQVGIGDTLVDAISDMAGSDAPARPDPADRRREPEARARATGRRPARCSSRPRPTSPPPTRRFGQGNGALWVKLSHRARVEVAKALNLLG